MVLDAERHPDQTGGRARQQQRADGAVDRPVGDVEQVVGGGADREVPVQARQVVVGDVRVRTS